MSTSGREMTHPDGELSTDMIDLPSLSHVGLAPSRHTVRPGGHRRPGLKMTVPKALPDQQQPWLSAVTLDPDLTRHDDKVCPAHCSRTDKDLDAPLALRGGGWEKEPEAEGAP